MEKNFHYGFAQTMASLEDLRGLVNTDLESFIDQALFHISGLKENFMEGGNDKMAKFPSLLNLLEIKIKEVLKGHLTSCENIASTHLVYNSKEIGIDTWNRILEFLGPLLGLARILNLKRRLIVHLSEGRIGIKGHIGEGDWEADYRMKTYKLTRLFLKKNAILTYNVDENEEQKDLEIVLNLDFSHNENQLFCIDLERELDITLCFSNILSNYRISREFAESLKDHYCIEITDSLGIRKHANIPMGGPDDFYSKDVLHFPFLFRPISLIIPKRGKIIPIEDLNVSQKWQNGKHKKGDGQFMPLTLDNRLYYLDFFSFFVG